MQDSSSIREKINQLLLNKYIGLNPSFKSSQCNYTMLDTFYNVIGDIELQNLYPIINPYLDGHSAMLSIIIESNNQKFIFNQPAYLLVYFSLWHWNSKIINEWPYDYESLESILRCSGYSSNLLNGA